MNFSDIVQFFKYKINLIKQLYIDILKERKLTHILEEATKD